MPGGVGGKAREGLPILSCKDPSQIATYLPFPPPATASFTIPLEPMLPAAIPKDRQPSTNTAIIVNLRMNK